MLTDLQVPNVQQHIREEAKAKMDSKVKVTIILQSDEELSGLLEWFENALTYDIGDFKLDPEAVENGEAITVEEID